jgi:UDP-N-acetyl-D-glucosamine/UDP-N-acetyl-D-galactosamine dehydrogenase
MKNNKIAIFGLGYVGLPLAVEFGKQFDTAGYDINLDRVDELNKGYDSTKEFTKNYIKSAKKLKITNQLQQLSNSTIFIVTVPTPIYKNKKPDFRNLISATQQIAKIIKKNSIVIYESTVYPGLTEEICIPLIEKKSKLIANKDFFYGYSPERINPGDKKHQLKNIKKIISGSNKFAEKKIAKIYKSIILKGVHVAPSVKIAEAAKVIENIQRDINVGFSNELLKIFNKMNLNTYDILEAANTKWNFLDFKPGLVGGHCIGVDPYYLLYKSSKINFKPNLITAGRKINDGMGLYYSNLINKNIKKKFKDKKIKILILGYTFKENCSDIRNTKVEDIYKYFYKKNHIVHIYDPWINSNLNKITIVRKLEKRKYDCIIVAVGHDYFLKLGKKKILSYGKKINIFYDIKNIFK